MTGRSPWNNQGAWGSVTAPALYDSLANRMRDFVVRTSFPDAATRVSLRAGSPTAEILRRAAEVDADLVVIGRSGSDERGAGSRAITEVISRTRGRPVLVVPTPMSWNHTPPLLVWVSKVTGCALRRQILRHARCAVLILDEGAQDP